MSRNIDHIALFAFYRRNRLPGNMARRRRQSAIMGGDLKGQGGVQVASDRHDGVDSVTRCLHGRGDMDHWAAVALAGARFAAGVVEGVQCRRDDDKLSGQHRILPFRFSPFRLFAKPTVSVPSIVLSRLVSVSCPLISLVPLPHHLV